MFRHRQRWFRRKTRRRIASVSVLVALAVMGAFAGRAIQDEMAPRLAFSPAVSAFADNSATRAADASLTAAVTRDLSVLQDFWDATGGPKMRVRYVDPPPRIRAGAPLRVSVHARELNGSPSVGALVEVSWKLGEGFYRDVTYTDNRGNVDVERRIDKSCKGKQCIVGVRIYQGSQQGLAYSKFTAR
jgi:hypothetical protein